MGFRLFLNLLPPSHQAKIQAQLLNKVVKKGDWIYQQGEASKGLYCVQQGIVGLKHTTPSGTDYLLRFFKTDDFFGHRSLISGEPYHGSAMALEPCELWMLPTDQLRPLLEIYPILYKPLSQILALELRQAELQRVMIAENHILPRVAQALIYLKELHPEHKWTRQEIAEFIASTSTTVMKALAELEQRGLIAQVGRRIQIVNPKDLAALSTEPL